VLVDWMIVVISYDVSDVKLLTFQFMT